jgi:hypothetical protein
MKTVNLYTPSSYFDLQTQSVYTDLDTYTQHSPVRGMHANLIAQDLDNSKDYGLVSLECKGNCK